MSNVAAGKLPLEKEAWFRPEEATNGNFEKYTGNEGYSRAPFPQTYTLDLERATEITEIRFLLWDNLGQRDTRKAERKYTFKLEISLDENFKESTEIFNNTGEEGGNGWFIFRFIKKPILRYVKLHCIHNTQNDNFHIVEFEVHDSDPEPITSSNQIVINVASTTGYTTKSFIDDLIEKSLKEKVEEIATLKAQSREAERNYKLFNEKIEVLNTLENVKGFHEQAEKNKCNSIYWLVASVVILIFLFGLLYSFATNLDWLTKPLKLVEENEFYKPYAFYFLVVYNATKDLIISMLIYVLSWSIKNYRAERHNYIINTHKGMNIKTATDILRMEDYTDTNKREIFDKATSYAFEHQSTGYSKDDQGTPSIVNTLLNKDIIKPE